MPIYIHSNVIKSNFNKITNIYNKTPMIVLKSNAYGLGIKNLIQILVETDCSIIVVHSILEAMEIRALTNKFTILLLDNQKIGNLQTLKDYNIIPIINSLDDLVKFADLQIPLCLNIDVGMNRTGLKPREVVDSLDMIKKVKDHIIHVMSHLHITHASPINEVNQEEKEVFDRLLEALSSYLNKEVKISFCSSNALEFGKEYIYSMPRIGKALYGLIHKNYGLEEAISIKESIFLVKKVYPGEIVGYNGYKIFHESYLGIISVGYFHGFSLAFAGKMNIKYKNNLYKIVSVSMEYVIIDFQDTKPEVNDEVTFFPEGFVKTCDEQSIYYLEQLIKMSNMEKIIL